MKDIAKFSEDGDEVTKGSNWENLSKKKDVVGSKTETELRWEAEGDVEDDAGAGVKGSGCTAVANIYGE